MSATRASRARRARSERSGEPCTAPRRAITIPDVMAVGSARHSVRRSPFRSSSFVRQILRTIELDKCASLDADRRGVSDPSGQRAGRQLQAGTGVAHAPLFLPPSGRALVGRHKAPSDCDVTGRRNFQHLSVLRSSVGRVEPLPERGCVAAVEHGEGDNLKVLTCPPFRPPSRATRGGDENGCERLLEGCSRRSDHRDGREGYRRKSV